MAEKRKDREQDAQDRQFFKKMMGIMMLSNATNPAAVEAIKEILDDKGE